MAHGIIEISDDNFDQTVIKSDIPVLVDFWAPWCGPCRAMAPILEEVAGSFVDKIKLAKCNVDENPATPAKFDVRSIPTLVFFKEGSVFEQVVGLTSKIKLEEILNRML